MEGKNWLTYIYTRWFRKWFGFCFGFCFFFLISSLEFSTQTLASSVSRHSIDFSFPISISCISFLVTLSKTSSTMLNKTDKKVYPYLVSCLMEKVFSLSPLSIMLSVDMFIDFSVRLGEFLFTLLPWEFYHELVFSFLKCCFCNN